MNYGLIFGLAVAAFFLLGLIGIAAVVSAQRRANRRAAALSPDDDWDCLGLESVDRSDMTLWRLLPTSAMTRVEYSISGGGAQDAGSVVFPVGGPAQLRLGELSLSAYAQGSGLYSTRWHGKVGGQSDRSIVFRDQGCVYGEVFYERRFPPPQRWRLEWPNRSLAAERPGWRFYQPVSVTENGRLMARSMRPGTLAQKVVVAARKDLPPDLVLAVAYISLLR